MTSNPKSRPASDIANDFIKNISSASKNEATIAVVKLLNNLHRIKTSSNYELELFESCKSVAEQVLKLHRFPDVEVAIRTFVEENNETLLIKLL
jgi:hypothetical protein